MDADSSGKATAGAAWAGEANGRESGALEAEADSSSEAIAAV